MSMLTLVLFTIFSKCNWLVTNVFIWLFVQITISSFTVPHPHLFHLVFQFYFYHPEHDQQLLSLSVPGALITGFICGLSFILSFHDLPVFNVDFGGSHFICKNPRGSHFSSRALLFFLQRDYLFDGPAAWKSGMPSHTQLLSGCSFYASHSKWGGFSETAASDHDLVPVLNPSGKKTVKSAESALLKLEGWDWRSSYVKEHLTLSQEPRVLVPTPTWWLTVILNCSSMESNIFFWPLWTSKM